MNYLNYLYSNRNSGIYWISFFIFILCLSVIKFMMNVKEGASLMLLFIPILIFLVIYFGFYLTGFLTFQKQMRYHRWVEEELETGNFIKMNCEIFQSPFSLKTPTQNYDAPIIIKPETVTFDVLETKDTILILGYVFDFGIFKRHISPLVISKNKNKEFLKKGAVLIDRFEMERQNNRVIIRFEKPYAGIRKMIISN